MKKNTMENLWTAAGGLLGAALGTAGAGTAAGMAGVTSIPVLTSLGQAAGLAILAPTPAGWIVALAAAGFVASAAVHRAAFSGGVNDARRKDLLRLQAEINGLISCQKKEKTS